MLDLIISTLTQGFIYALLSFGVYITYKILDFPDPLGPTMAVMSDPKVSTVLSGNDLKPWISNAFKYNASTSFCPCRSLSLVR